MDCLVVIELLGNPELKTTSDEGFLRLVEPCLHNDLVR